MLRSGRVWGNVEREMPMRAFALAGLMAAGMLAGCTGGEGRDQLIETCVAEGEAPETCACIVDAMEDKLSADLFKRTVVAIVREQRDVGTFILSLPDDEKMEFYLAEQEMEKCDLSAVAEE